MARTSSETAPTPTDHQQMDRSNDPAVTAQMDADAPAAAMTSRQGLTGSAVGVGSVAYDDQGAFDVGTGARPVEILETGAPTTGKSNPDAGAVDRLQSGGLSPSGDAGPGPRAKRLSEANSFEPAHDPDERRVSSGPVALPE